MKEPADREAPIVSDVELFAARLTLMAWGWKNLDPWQRAVLKSNDRYMILNCSRQSGKSSILAVKAYQKAITTENALILITAEQRQSNEDLRKIKNLNQVYDKYVRKRYRGKLTLTPIKENVTELEFGNGARIIALPGNEKVRGYSAPDMVVMDEAGYVDDEVFIAVDPMMEVSKGQLILASTPAGTSGFFAREWNNPRYTARFRVPWNECPRISPESIADKRMLYGEAYVKQEYECFFQDELTALFTARELEQSVDPDEEVFAKEMQDINKELYGEPELIE